VLGTSTVRHSSRSSYSTPHLATSTAVLDQINDQWAFVKEDDVGTSGSVLRSHCIW
jgi:hypothetical protein